MTRGDRISPHTRVDGGENIDHALSVGQQLRLGTADLHLAVEQVSDLPGSVTTLEDYASLLSSFYTAHALIEASLGAQELAPGWLGLGIDIASHGQLDALTEDLARLGVRPERAASPQLQLRSPAEALGCLYVVEGSALGRRVLGPQLKDKLGEVPSAFFDGRDGQPQAWRQVQHSLKCSTDDRLEQQAILAGARMAFGVFLDVLRRRAARSDLSSA